MKNLITLFTLLISSLLLSGCYEDLNENAAPETQNYITPNDFAGADSAQNLTTGIRISWTAVDPSKNIIGYRIYKYSGGIPLLIATVGPQITNYIDGNVISGAKYQYTVKAVDPSNSEDTNTVRVSTLAWGGLSSVTSNGMDTINLTFDGSIQGVSLRIYLRRTGVATRSLIATLSTPSQIQAGTYTINTEPDGTTLRAGSEYNIMAEVVETGTGAPDGNQKEFQVSTRTYGFDGPVGAGPGWKNIATARAFGRAGNIQQASDLDIAPQEAKVDIAFIPFVLPGSLSKSNYFYRIVRFSENEQVNTATLNTPCPTTFNATTSLKPCVVADDISPITGIDQGLIRFSDRDVWVASTDSPITAPPRFRYTMVIKHLIPSTGASYTEAMPMPDVQKFSVLVPVPPDYMVLVNRESVNYEFCKTRGLEPDALNRNRCQDSEKGFKPYNSGPGNSPLALADGFFDMGYNLFVDRYPLACKADSVLENNLNFDFSNSTTIQAYGQSNPTLPGTTAAPTVLYNIHGSTTANSAFSNCKFNKTPSAGTPTWITLNQFQSQLGASATAAYQTTLTNKPDDPNLGNLRFKFSYPNWSSELAQQACESFNELGYGAKRIPRMREQRAYSARPFSFASAGGNIVDFYRSQIISATDGSTTWDQGKCVQFFNTKPSGGAIDLVNGGSGVNANQLLSPVSNIDQQAYTGVTTGSPIGPTGFAIGASATAFCMSKYGVNDILDSVSTNNNLISNSATFNTAWYPVSDYFLRKNNITNTAQNEYKGLLSPIDSGNMDVDTYSMIIGTTNTWSIGTAGLTKYNLPLGLPNLPASSNNANVVTSSSNYGKTLLAIFAAADNTANYAKVGARYAVTTNPTDYSTRVRCVLPAD